MKPWIKSKATKALLHPHSWAVVSDPLGLVAADGPGLSDEILESQARSSGELILRLRLGDVGEFPVIDLGYCEPTKRFVVRFLVDDDKEDDKASSSFETFNEALLVVQKSIDATEGWSHWGE